jgi:hypothetical protein
MGQEVKVYEHHSVIINTCKLQKNLTKKGYKPIHCPRGDNKTLADRRLYDP